MSDQTSEARIAAALYVALRDTDTTQFYDSDSPMDDFSAAVLKATLAADPTLAADLIKAREYDALMDDVKAEAQRTGMVVAIPVHIAADLALAAAVRGDLEAYGTACLARRADGSIERIPPEMVRLDVQAAKEAERAR